MLSKALLQAYRKMREIRTFEEAVVRKIPTVIFRLHYLYTGEEAHRGGDLRKLLKRKIVGSYRRGRMPAIAKL
jgi:pyruvate dehydrogenase E1 component alpha subunit